MKLRKKDAKTYTFDLFYFKDDSIHPFVIVRLKVYGVRQYADSGKFISLTPECAHPMELDEQIDRLHTELEIVRQEGHRQFALGRPSLRSKP